MTQAESILDVYKRQGICWDQWFPETARGMALKGAEILFYPTAIGSEPVSYTHLDVYKRQVKNKGKEQKAKALSS